MEILLNELLDDIEYIDIDDKAIINTTENMVVFGANGIGKTTIYKKLKNEYNIFDYLDYEETKDLFKRNKKQLEISVGINKLEELSNQIEKVNSQLSTQIRFKQKKITSKSSAQKISPQLGEKYSNNEFSKIEITDEELVILKSLYEYIDFIINNYESLSQIGDITEELQMVDKNYLMEALMLIESHVTVDVDICPVCGSKVINLKEVINNKINSLIKIREECLVNFIRKYENKSEIEIKTLFPEILNSVKKISFDNFVNYYLLDGNLDEINAINSAVEEKIKLIKEKDEMLKKQEESFKSLVDQKELYTDYLRDNFRAIVNFDGLNKKVIIKFDRNVDTFSTGEINIILFITKLFSYLGSDKQLLVIDDPISSYDLVNQYHIVFHLCKIIAVENKHVIIFTHNPDVINVINSQRNSAYQYFFFDKIDGKIIMNSLPKNMKSSANVLFVDNLITDDGSEINKYIKLMMKRNDNNPNDELSKVLHYDDLVELGLEFGEFEGCTNKFFVDYIENDEYLKIFDKIDFESLCSGKIITLSAIRVWIEYKLNQISSVDLSGVLSKKIDKFFKKNNDILYCYPNLKREQLMNKKVMLNQNCHVNSQVQPFYYALSIKMDDIKKEIADIKNLFDKK